MILDAVSHWGDSEGLCNVGRGADAKIGISCGPRRHTHSTVYFGEVPLRRVSMAHIFITLFTHEGVKFSELRSLNRRKVGRACDKVSAIWHDPVSVCPPPRGSARGEGKVLRAGNDQEKNAKEGAFSGESWAVALRAAQTHAGMAGVEDTMRAAVPSWCGGLELEMIYRRTNYIHEMSCEEVGPLLYSRMCCAGRSEPPSPSLRAGQRRTVGRGGAAGLL